ncbi:VOC family protein [Balneolaceae bacterium ANBcel3]|nr:VOC family protein [Balneolaceae bacterium ANBcel3]
MKFKDKGLHHITVIAGPAQTNYDFYTRILGLRMVLQSVNQDDTGTWHLFYANGSGEPGSSLTFFPFRHASRTGTGTGEATTVSFAVPTASKTFWIDRFREFDVPVKEAFKRFGLEVLPFSDPDGLQLELVFDDAAKELPGWDNGPVPSEHTLRGFWSTTLRLTETETTAKILQEVMDFEPAVTEENMHLFRTGSAIGNAVLLEKAEDSNMVHPGRGTIHHVAFRARDRKDLELMRQKVIDLNLNIQPTPVIDRHVFESVYFRTPAGVLFEIATDPPGYASVVEKEEDMGKELFLPPWLEPKRSEIAAKLDPLEA